MPLRTINSGAPPFSRAPTPIPAHPASRQVTPEDGTHAQQEDTYIKAFMNTNGIKGTTPWY
ncbi:hypothetical protein PRZ48_008954 [Zasmidium cellare]|uniref:Uncharacterized protein n=1 Tax=Zasmidium cellare TaxID=395010 RepID=A0ABR0EGY1_ZASCE|nr:hypothetical protein PRZ48_008954 [Zasmidium cellare]